MKSGLPAANVGAASLALACSLPALCQAQSQFPLEGVVVTAQRVAQPLSKVLADVTVIDRDEIDQAGAGAVADVLSRVPGVEIARNGGAGSTTSVFVRGAETRFTAVFIDGVRIDTQSTGGAAWESIPLSQIERIEVVRGPAAAVYGSDALGGVIQLFTKRGQGPAKPQLTVGAGSLGTTRAAAAVSGSQGALDYSLGLARDRSFGFNARPIPSMNPDRDGYRSVAAHARLGLQVAEGQRLEATLLGNALNAQYDGSLNNDDRTKERLYATGISWLSQWNGAWSTRAGVTDSLERYETTPSPYLSITRLHGVLVQSQYRSDGQIATITIERREDRLDNAPLERQRAQDGLALGWSFAKGAHTVQVNARHDQDSEFGGHNTGSIAYGYTFAQWWRATASVANAFRAPTLYQRFSVYGSAGLVPETSRDAEAGLHYARQDTTAAVVVYRNAVSNLINFADAGPCASPYGCYANVARALYEGLTVSASRSFGALATHASIDLQDPHDETTGHLLARRARQHATVGVDTHIAGWSVAADVIVSARRFDNAANTVVLGGYTLINLTAHRPIARDWTLLARVENANTRRGDPGSDAAHPRC
jgi:vitamin B12 transporter